MNQSAFKLFALLVPIALVVMVSGCTGGDTTLGGPGLVIKTFEIDSPTLESGDEARLTLIVENKGAAKAQDVMAELVGIDSHEWNSKQNGDIDDLAGVDPRYNAPGASASVYWDMTAPELSGSLKQTYTPKVRVSYLYKTTASKLITLVNKDELRRLSQAGKALPTASSTQYTSGPIAVDITTGAFIRTSDSGYSGKSFPLTIKFTNTGGGTVSQGTGYQGVQQDYEVEYDLEMPSGLSSRCSSDTVNLYKGKDYTLTCTVEVTSSPTVTEQKNIQMELTYRYYIDAQTTVTVSGTGTT